MPTAIWSLQLRSSNAHYDLEFSVDAAEEQGLAARVLSRESNKPHLAHGNKGVRKTKQEITRAKI